MGGLRESRGEILRTGALVALFGLVVWASHRHGAPTPLPDLALGWALLLHVERAAALLAVTGAVMLIGWRALHGDFPSRFGQIEYAVEEAAADTRAVVAGLEERLRLLESRGWNGYRRGADDKSDGS